MWWSGFLAWIRTMFGREKEKPDSLPALLGESVKLSDVRSEMQGEYAHPTMPIPRRAVEDIVRVVLHCTADDDKPAVDVYDLALYDTSPECHINPGKGCPTITYHYYIEFVGGDCVVHWCLDYDVKAWHVATWNRSSLAVAIDYDGISNLPELKWAAAAKVVAWVLHELGLPSSAAVFHRELQTTGWSYGPSGEKVYRKMCPGEHLDPYEFRRKVAGYLAQL